MQCKLWQPALGRTRTPLIRTFLNLGPFAPNPSSASKPLRYTEQQVLNFTQRQMYDVVSNVAEYRHFIPWCVNSVVLGTGAPSQQPCSVPEAKRAVVAHIVTQADLEVGFKAFREQYTSTVTCETPWRVEARSSNSHIFRTLTTSWDFIPYSITHPHGITPEDPSAPACLVRFNIEFEFASVLYSQISSVFFDQVCKEMIHAFKKRCIQVYH